MSHSQQILLLGSCFAEHMGEHLADNRFQADINPFGTLYNPLSVAGAIERLADARLYLEKELFKYAGVWHSRDHHSRFSHPDREICLQQINDSYIRSAGRFKQTDWLLVTFGTAFVYFDKEDGNVVANCHKQPERNFDRRLITPEEIVARWRKTIDRINRNEHPFKIIFTVSPIRHIRDGLHANQLSKSTLLLAIDRLCQDCPEAEYFPAYEIVTDELRDYRFYASDMAHPSDTAIEYIWERFSETYFSLKTINLCQEWQKINKALNHRPLIPDSTAYKNFIMQNLLKMKNISEKYPFFDLRKEIRYAENLLK